MRKKITKRQIDLARATAEQDGKRIYLRDTDLIGFVALATPTGGVSYLCEYRQNGKQHRIKIGQHGPMTPAQARSKAQEALGRIASGETLIVPKNKIVVRDLLENFYKHHAKPNRYWHERKLHVENNAGPILEQNISTIKRANIASLIDDASLRAPSAGRHLLTALRPFFKWAVQRGHIEVNPCSDLTAPGKAGVRERVLSDDEIRQIWSASQSLGFPFGPIITMLILTAQRRSEVAGMEISEIHEDIWNIPAYRTKNNRDHEVDLHPLALQALRNLPILSGKIFSTNARTAPSGFSRAKGRLDARLPNIKPWRLHDLRRTAASGMSKLGTSPIVVEHVLNHISGERGGLVSVYQQYSYRPERRQALLAWGDHVRKLLR